MLTIINEKHLLLKGVVFLEAYGYFHYNSLRLFLQWRSLYSLVSNVSYVKSQVIVFKIRKNGLNQCVRLQTFFGQQGTIQMFVFPTLQRVGYKRAVNFNRNKYK